MTGLDLTPLRRRAGLLARLRTIGHYPRYVVGSTMTVLVLLGGIAAILVSLFVPEEIEWGGFFCGMMLLAMGAWLTFDILRNAGGGAPLEDFARVNDLDLTRSIAAPEYAGSLFRSGERVVEVSVRTRTMPLLEVGDSWPTAQVQIRLKSSGAVSVANPPASHGFLRVVLPAGELPPLPEFPVPWELDEALTALLGDYSLELHGRELTVMGEKSLPPTDPDTVAAAFHLAEALARYAESTMPPGARVASAAVPETQAMLRSSAGRQARHPLAIVAATLGILIVSSVGFAILMSILDDYPANDGVFTLVVSFFILAIGGSFALLLRWAFKGRRRSRRERSRDEAAMNESGRGRRAGFSMECDAQKR